MPRLEHRPRASDDIAEIWDFIAEDSLAQADAFVDRLDRKLQLLATQPLMGRARDELAAGLAQLSLRALRHLLRAVEGRHRRGPRTAQRARHRHGVWAVD
jgi:toxin ParE1/3/4